MKTFAHKTGGQMKIRPIFGASADVSAENRWSYVMYSAIASRQVCAHYNAPSACRIRWLAYPRPQFLHRCGISLDFRITKAIMIKFRPLTIIFHQICVFSHHNLTVSLFLPFKFKFLFISIYSFLFKKEIIKNVFVFFILFFYLEKQSFN